MGKRRVAARDEGLKSLVVASAREVIDDMDLGSFSDQRGGEALADEPSASGDKNLAQRSPRPITLTRHPACWNSPIWARDNTELASMTIGRAEPSHPLGSRSR